jgi:hypothetical protein
MDKFSGARHSAYTMRRFYPAMYGRNLTFMPSQYGADEPGEGKKASASKTTQREKSTLEVLGEIGGSFIGRKLVAQEEEAAIAREGMRQKNEADAYARKVSADALAAQMNRKPFNPLPWLVGGLGVAVVGGLVYYNMSMKKRA